MMVHNASGRHWRNDQGEGTYLAVGYRDKPMVSVQLLSLS